MRRVNVIGSSGAGKTTFARALADRLGVPLIELDAVNWGPRWTQLAADEFRLRVDELTQADGWVVDGNYTSRMGDLVMRRADTIVWLDLPLRTVLWRILRRTVERIRSREELWAGNRESARGAFLSRESLLLFALRTYRRRKRLFTQRLADPSLAHVTVQRFASAREADRWLARVGGEMERGRTMPAPPASIQGLS